MELAVRVKGFDFLHNCLSTNCYRPNRHPNKNFLAVQTCRWKERRPTQKAVRDQWYGPVPSIPLSSPAGPDSAHIFPSFFSSGERRPLGGRPPHGNTPAAESPRRSQCWPGDATGAQGVGDRGPQRRAPEKRRPGSLGPNGRTRSAQKGAEGTGALRAKKATSQPRKKRPKPDGAKAVSMRGRWGRIRGGQSRSLPSRFCFDLLLRDREWVQRSIDPGPKWLA